MWQVDSGCHREPSGLSPGHRDVAQILPWQKGGIRIALETSQWSRCHPNAIPMPSQWFRQIPMVSMISRWHRLTPRHRDERRSNRHGLVFDPMPLGSHGRIGAFDAIAMHRDPDSVFPTAATDFFFFNFFILFLVSLLLFFLLFFTLSVLPLFFFFFFSFFCRHAACHIAHNRHCQSRLRSRGVPSQVLHSSSGCGLVNILPRKSPPLCGAHSALRVNEHGIRTHAAAPPQVPSISPHDQRSLPAFGRQFPIAKDERRNYEHSSSSSSSSMEFADAM